MEILDNFKVHLHGQGLSQNTIKSYTMTFRRFIKWIEQAYGDFNVKAITSLDVADYRRQLIERGRKPATINHALDVITSFFTWACSNKLAQINPSIGIKRMQEQKNAPRWLDRRKLGTLIRTVQKYGIERDIVLIALLLHTGLRVSEAVTLQLEDVAIRERTGAVRVCGKGDKYREVPLNITVRRILSGYISKRKGKWLFPNRRGRHITTRAAEDVISKYGRLARLEVTPHMLRHTFAKRLVEAGVGLDRIAALMGHSNLNTTARYTKPSVQDLEHEVEKLAWD